VPTVSEVAAPREEEGPLSRPLFSSPGSEVLSSAQIWPSPPHLPTMVAMTGKCIWHVFVLQAHRKIMYFSLIPVVSYRLGQVLADIQPREWIRLVCVPVVKLTNY
jgi:hypothetical protein